MKKGYGIFGGTFDPPHAGHQFLAANIAAMPFVKQLIIVPTFDPPYKQRTATYDVRYEMCQIAFNRYAVFCSKHKYAYSMLNDIKNRFDGPLYFFVGNEWNVDKWKKPELIRKIAKIIHVTRISHSGGRQFEDIKPIPYGPDLQVPLPLELCISSTEIRYMVWRGLPINGLADHRIVDYIKENNLYGIPKAKSDS